MEKIIDENKQGESLILEAKENNSRKLYIESRSGLGPFEAHESNHIRVFHRARQQIALLDTFNRTVPALLCEAFGMISQGPEIQC